MSKEPYHPLEPGRLPLDLGRFAIPSSDSSPLIILSYPPPDLGRPSSPYLPGDPKLFRPDSLTRTTFGPIRSSLPEKPGLRCGGTNLSGFGDVTTPTTSLSLSKLGTGDRAGEPEPVLPNGRREIWSEPGSDRVRSGISWLCWGCGERGCGGGGDGVVMGLGLDVGVGVGVGRVRTNMRPWVLGVEIAE